MSLDPTTIISSLIGSLIAVVGSIVVATIYISNNKNLEKKRMLNEQIQKTYIDKGIFSMQVGLSQYGTNTIFGFNDLIVSAVRINKLGEKSNLKQKIDEIKQRPTIDDLLQRKFSYTMDSFSYIRSFGIKIYGPMIRTIQCYSDLLSDFTNIDVLNRQISSAGIDEFERSGKAVMQILQSTQLYLQTRLDNLKDYILQKDFDSYTDFLNILKEEKYARYMADFEQYSTLLTNWMDSLRSQNSESRKSTSIALSKWLTENSEKNPLE